MLLSRMLGETMGVLLYIEQMTPIIEENAARIGLGGKFGGARFVGFTFDDVLKAYDEPASLLERFHDAARAMIRDGVDVIIPGEAPLCALLMKHCVSRVDGVPIVDALGATIKMAESMVDLKRSSGLAPARHGYFTDQPPRERLKELFALYGIDRLQP
jgi:Asp/Glu/hydantoin racemase